MSSAQVAENSISYQMTANVSQIIVPHNAGSNWVCGPLAVGGGSLPSSKPTTVLNMSLTTVEQVRRVFRVVAGFTLLLAGAVMLVTPGPGWLVIVLGLGLLAAEFVWARRLMDRIKREGDRIKTTVFGKTEAAAEPDRAEEALVKEAQTDERKS
jgi:uncharacterized protein (TIGR02611 family)